MCLLFGSRQVVYNGFIRDIFAEYSFLVNWVNQNSNTDGSDN